MATRKKSHSENSAGSRDWATEIQMTAPRSSKSIYLHQPALAGSGKSQERGHSMNRRLKLLPSSGLVFSVVVLAVLGTVGQVNVVTQHNDLARTGQNLSETTLTPANVNVNQFGLLFRITVDNQVYAQPLVVSNVSIGGGTHNAVYVATTSNSVYALDADTGTQYWHDNLGTPISNANYGSGCVDINGNAGIVGTPVIDPTA